MLLSYTQSGIGNRNRKIRYKAVRYFNRNFIACSFIQADYFFFHQNFPICFLVIDKNNPFSQWRHITVKCSQLHNTTGKTSSYSHWLLPHCSRAQTIPIDNFLINGSDNNNFH